MVVKLKELRKQAHFTQQKLADKLGVARSTVAMWETNGTDCGMDMARKIAKLFGVSVDELLGLRTDAPQTAPDAIRVPVLGAIPAGIPVEAVEDILDWEEIPASMGNGGKEYFALQIHGDSMIPTYQDGDVVILRRQETCESGQDCAVMVNGSEATFKRVRRSLDGIVLQPLNSAYAPLVYTNAQIEAMPVRILGVAIEIRRKLI